MSVAQAGAITVKITVDGNDVPEDHQASFVVDRDIHQPDMATIVLYNQDHRYSKLAVAAPVEIQIGSPGKSIYKGEIVGLEPVYRAGEKQRISIRAMNKFHRLIRKRKSVTFMDKTDQQILQQVAQDAGLSLDWKHETTINYKHVYQHNQTDMEFVRMRAARMGCHVWCIGDTLNCKQPDLSQAPAQTLAIDTPIAEQPQLRGFHPRMSSAPIAQKMTVKGWNPETKQLITGTASAQPSKLGSQNASAASGNMGNEENFTVDHPIWSVEEANAIAKAKLQDAALTYMTGEAECIGDPGYDIATVIKLNVNTQDPNDVFNGNYYVMGVTHRYMNSGKERDSGYVTHLKVARDAQKGST
ncbi:MAG TPA: contractile injection system protein, VgrG/Pvc8 family [Kofleriaceae bacterium]